MYFRECTSAQAMVMLMKIYEQLTDNFQGLNGYQILAMVYDIIGDSKMKPCGVSKMGECIEAG